jgi:hypothetical protein
MSWMEDQPSRRSRDDFDDEFAVGRRDRYEDSDTSAGMVGFIFSMVAIGLLVVVAILWVFMAKEDAAGPNVDRKRFMFLWFMFLDVLAFFSALSATIMAGRALAPSNRLYRGWATFALVLGILEMVATVIFFFVVSCFLLLLLGG